MGIEERLAGMTILEFIEKVADRAEAMSALAGVGAAETVGHLMSYFLEYPEDIEPFLVGGFDELPDDWMVRGRLTYTAINGKITHPETARRARIIKRMERGQKVTP